MMQTLIPEQFHGKIPRSHWSLWRLLFGLLPLGIACLLSLYAVTLEEEFLLNQSQRHLDKDLHEIIRDAEPEKNYFRRHFLRFRKILFKNKNNDRSFEALVKKASDRLGLQFDAYLFNEEGRLIRSAGLSLREPEIVQKTWSLMRGVPSIKPDEAQTYKKRISDVFGLDFRYVKVAEMKRRIFSLRSRSGDGVGFWDDDGKPGFGGLLMIVWKTPGQTHLLKRVFSARRKQMLLATVDRSGRVGFIKKAKGLEFWRREIFSHFVMSRERFWFGHEFLWTTAPVGNLTLSAGRPEPGIDLSGLRQKILLFFLFVAPAFLFFAYNRIIRSQDSYFSIRLKLILLFMFAIIIPLLGVAFLGFRTLRDRQDVLVFESYKTAREILLALDVEFPKEQAACLELFRSLRDSPIMRSEPEKIREMGQHLLEQRKLSRLEVRDLTGKVLVNVINPGRFAGTEQMFDTLGNLSIERSLQERLVGLGPKAMNQADLVTRMVLESPEMGFVYIMDRPDKTHELRLGLHHMYMYWDVFRDKTHPYAYVAFETLIPWVVDEYLKKQIKASVNDERGFKLVFRRDSDGFLYPRGASLDARMRDLIEKARVSCQPVSERIIWEGTPYLALALPGRNLEGHTFLALRSENEALKGIEIIRNLIIIGILVAIFLAVLTGIVLAATFIDPISELTKGIQALRNRDTTYRIPTQRKDEFGDLALTFNHMIGDLKEMEFARVVQEALYPQKVPTCKGFDIDLAILPASDLGGDYCDAIPMENAKILIVIGDVTGHGVSSALLVAMAKAVVYQVAKSGDHLLSLMRRLNYLIFNLLKRKKMMTLFAAELDFTTGVFRYTNAGHPFPMYCSKEGKTQRLEIARYPLGASLRKGDFEELELVVEPGGIIVLYTDGLVEAINDQGVMFGYNKLEEKIAEFRHLSASEIKLALLKTFYDHYSMKELDDDITIIVVKREITV